MAGTHKSTDAQKRAVKKYQDKRDSITIRPTFEDGKKIRNAAEKSGKSMQAFILSCVLEKIDMDNWG